MVSGAAGGKQRRSSNRLVAAAEEAGTMRENERTDGTSGAVKMFCGRGGGRETGCSRQFWIGRSVGSGRLSEPTREQYSKTWPGRAASQRVGPRRAIGVGLAKKQGCQGCRMGNEHRAWGK